MANDKPVIDIDLNTIFYGLHTVAMSAAKKKNNDIYIANTAVDEKNKTYVGSGEFNIFSSVLKDKNGKYITDKYIVTDTELSTLSGDALDTVIKDKAELLKTDTFPVIQTYVEFFVGEESAKKITKESLEAILVEKDIIKAESTNSIDINKSIVENLFEHKPIVEASNLDTATVSPTYGYQIAYDVTANNKKQYSRADSVKKWAKTAGTITGFVFAPLMSGIGKVIGTTIKAVFSGIGKAADAVTGGVLSDIASLKVGIGGKDVNVGKPVADLATTAVKGTAKAAADAAKELGGAAVDAVKGTAKVAGKAFNFAPTIEASTAASKLNNTILKRYPNANIKCELWKSSELIDFLRQQKKMSNKITKSGLDETLYTVTVTLADDSVAFDEITKNFLDLVNKAFDRTGLTTALQISKDQILQIDGFITRYNYKSNYSKDKKLTTASLDKSTNSIMTLLFENVLVIEATAADNVAEIISLLEANKDRLDEIMTKFIVSPKVNDSDVYYAASRTRSEIKDKQDFAKQLLSSKDDLTTFFSIYRANTRPGIRTFSMLDAFKDIISKLKTKKQKSDDDNDINAFKGRLFIIVSKLIKYKEDKQSLITPTNKNNSNQKKG